MRLLLSEMRRALHRRLVWVLIGLATGLSIVGGVIGFIDSAADSVRHSCAETNSTRHR